MKLAAIKASATLTIRPKPASAPSLNKDKYKSEITNKVKLVAFQFASIPQRKITKRYAYKFRQINLYKFYHMKRCEDIYQDQISIEKGTLNMKKVTGSYKNYE